MARWRMYWAYATRSLVRAGQRGILAIFCVAVGVLAIVALQLVGNSVDRALITNIVEANGGDIRIVTIGLLPLRAADLTYLDQLQAAGRITGHAATFEAEGDATLSDGTDATFTLIAIPEQYPLLGDANFIAPRSDLHLRAVVHGDQAAVNVAVADQLHAHVGDSITIKLRDGRSLPATIAAIFQNGGGFANQQVFVAQSLLDAAPGPVGSPIPPSYTTVYLTVPPAQVEGVARDLRSRFSTARVITVADLLRQRQQQINQIRLFLQLVGLLALFIGGIGIVNTMQVLLRRRTIEIAVLKTTGYRQSDLVALFGLEAGLIGLLGGIVGTAAGIGASDIVRIVVERAFYLHLPVALDPTTLASGVAIGLATALIFGLLPIIQASRVRPLAILREYAEGNAPLSRAANAGLLFLLSLLFIALATSILGNLLIATIVVYGGAVIISALGFGFSILIAGIARLPIYEQLTPRILISLLIALGVVGGGGLVAALFIAAGVAIGGGDGSFLNVIALVFIGGPGLMVFSLTAVYACAALLNALMLLAQRSWKTALMLAYRNLGRARGRSTATLTALFVGVFGIGMVVILGQGIKDTITTTLASLTQYNVFVIVPPSQIAPTRAALLANPAITPRGLVLSSIGNVRPERVGALTGSDLIKQLRKSDDLDSLSSIEGFDLQAGAPVITLKAGRNLGPADGGTNHGVISWYLSQPPYSVRVGDTILLASQDGMLQRGLVVVGFYGTGTTGNANFGGVLTDMALANDLAGPNHLAVFSLKIDPPTLPALRRQIVQQVPGAIVFSLVDLTALIDQILSDIIVMLSTIASLAMLAGLVIIANAVALAMLERRREIGILKSVGHSSGSILATVLIENGLIGFLSALVALTLVVGAVLMLSTLVLHITLLISWSLVLGLLAAAVLVTIAVATSVAWNAVRLRPLEVLRYE